MRDEDDSENPDNCRQACDVILPGIPCKTACKSAYENDNADKKSDAALCEGFHGHITRLRFTNRKLAAIQIFSADVSA